MNISLVQLLRGELHCPSVVRLFFAFFWGMALLTTASAQGRLDQWKAYEVPEFVQTLAVQASGQVLMGGISQFGYRRLSRLTLNAEVDSSFQTPNPNGTVISVVELPNGKIVIAGNFSQLAPFSQPSVTRNGLALLNADGSPDAAFNPNAVANGGQGNVFRVLPLTSGKLLVGGHFTNIGGSGRSKIARLNADGTVDTTFNAGAMNISDYIWNFAEQPDGKLVVSGGFTQIGGVARNNVARLQVDGTVDTGFIANATYSTAAYPSVNTAMLQSDGSIVITGQFDRVNGLVRSNLARLNNDGSVDASYSTANATNAGIHWALTEPDGKVVIGGAFTNVGGSARAKLARLNADGSVDSTFGDQFIAEGDVGTLARQSDGRIIAGGDFLRSSGVNRWRMARFYEATPVPLMGMAQISTSNGSHSGTCALSTSGVVRCWGFLQYGPFEDGHRPVPVDVQGLATTSVTSRDQVCAVTAAGSALCWGRNDYGQLGNGFVGIPNSFPGQVTGLDSGVRAMSAGGLHTCALTLAGAVLCWGDNQFGQLGDGTTTQRLTPVAVTGLASGVQAISAGFAHTCALTNAGAVKCWGGNDSGPLGDGTTTQRNTPVTALSSGVRTISAGTFHTCAVTTAGAAHCWGSNDSGQLGSGTTGGQVVFPITVSGLGTGAQSISAGEAHTCAVMTSSAARCWGSNTMGQLGDGTTTTRPLSVPVNGLGSGVQAISTAYDHTCALMSTGSLSCWGSNEYGQLGDGTYFNRLVPVPVVPYVDVNTIFRHGFDSTIATPAIDVDRALEE